MNETGSSEAQTRDALDLKVGMALRRMVQRIAAANDQAAREQNLHPTDFTCIGFLHHAGRPVSPKQINAYMGLSSGSGTALLDRLERAGYTRRLPNPDDRRSILIELDAGRSAETVQRYLEIEQLYKSLTDTLTLEALEGIARFLEQMSVLTDKITKK